MSTTAEYYVRNMSTAEFERFYHRLQSSDRAATLASLRSEMEGGIERALAAERGARLRETRALQQGVEGLRAQMEERAACNARLTASLGERMEEFRRQGAERHAQAQRAIQILEEESRTLQRHLDETRDRVRHVEGRATALERAQREERVRREAEARRIAGHAGALEQGARSLLGGVSDEDARALGLSELRARVEAALEHARAHERAGAGQATAATMASAHRDATELVDQREARRDEEAGALAAIGLSLSAAKARLRELGTGDVRRFLGGELARHEAEVRALEAAAGKRGLPWADRKALLDDARGRAAALQRETGTLHARYEELLQQAATREAVLRGLVEALVGTWGAEFEMDVDYSVRGDARSPMVFRTKRGPHAPNVQATLGLDGRMEVHFTGYRGTECASDLDAVKQVLRRGGALKLVEGASRVEPDRPNPPDVGPANLAPVRLVGPDEAAASASRRQR
ncbi:MAG: hypothetical protein Q8S73_20405 [Deltaproteobacteria bacterium]|nr:hypothetical protein [Myxococcales bacterium]MDP3216482.1 hypothetical protein [Deltaproteobacteria bacterium]